MRTITWKETAEHKDRVLFLKYTHRFSTWSLCKRQKKKKKAITQHIKWYDIGIYTNTNVKKSKYRNSTVSNEEQKNQQRKIHYNIFFFGG